MSTQLELQLDETEAKIAVLRHAYRNTPTKPAFMLEIEAKTHIPAIESNMAWDIFDYLAWEETDENRA